MDYYQFISDIIDQKQGKLTEASDQIWDFCETRYQEHRSAEVLCKVLEEEGFSVQRSAGEIETAFVGTYGKGAPIIAILGEFDALSGMSQVAGVTFKEPLQEGANGHGCGHNLLGAGSLGAAVAVRHYLERSGLPGTIRYYGCPAEEGGGGKAYMARAGLFKDVDAAFTWHPWDENLAYNSRMLATCQIQFTFRGNSSHASASPHLGRSALDAVGLMNAGANYLREHLISEARLHYAITDAGGHSPNVVQAKASVLYKLRAPRMSQVKEMIQRVCDIASGAAMMTGTRVEHQVDGASADLIPNFTLSRVMHQCFTELGGAAFTEDEQRFARGIQDSFSAEEKRIVRNGGGRILSEQLQPYSEEQEYVYASTDVGDVSWIVPTGQVYVTTCAYGTQPHSWQLVAQGKSSAAHKGMLLAGKVLAASAIHVLQHPAVIAAAKSELKEQLDGEVYQSLIPPEVQPAASRAV
ncbi:amidohydrolase [Paenibacillus odorifer]|uniref:M20 family metallopeptidase n=1 Tax=Paenibacillus odorifer TaxID=189426 RepID=UPI00096D9F91|nr:M20 family metallopeptidase [Paenibacillus odorifer]OMD84033.1 amidohydrolase [Paenibacillus odorifer]